MILKIINHLINLYFRIKFFRYLEFNGVPWKVRFRSGFDISNISQSKGKLKIILDSGVSFEKGVWIKGSSLLTIGSNTYIGRRTIIGCNDSVTIGKNVLIADHVSIRDTDHEFTNSEVIIKNQGLVTDPIIIEDDVWIAHGVIVTKGVVIGKGSVIGANSVVTKNIPPYSVAVGIPAKVIKSRLNTTT